MRVEDGTSDAQARGKQSLRPRGIWYSRVSGIWQSVWLEAVPAVHVAKIRVHASLREYAEASKAKNVAPNPFLASASAAAAAPRALTTGSFAVSVTLDAAAPSSFDPRVTTKQPMVERLEKRSVLYSVLLPAACLDARWAAATLATTMVATGLSRRA